MRRQAAAILAVLAVGTTSHTSAGEWLREGWARLKGEVCINNMWPDQYVPADRVAVRAPFQLMIANGWRMENTLSDYHFDPESGALNEAGKLRVRDILTRNPAEHRTIFVLRGQSQEVTATRLAAAQEAAARVDTDGAPAEVLETPVIPRGTNAWYTNSVQGKFNSTLPDPRLPAMNRAADNQ